MHKGRWTAAAVAVLIASGSLGMALPASAAGTGAARTAAPACVTGWGSLPKTGSDAQDAPRSLTNIRTGRHDCYDRIVFDVPGSGTGPLAYDVRYVRAFIQDPSGRKIPVSGGAILEVRVHASAYNPETGDPTYPGRAGKALPGVDLKGYRTFRDAKFGSSFEGITQVGLGVRARLPFRVLRLPDHLVVDVAHTW
ncbi:AMIN-like domain-containing (lipo)protein [Streptomyces sp. NPDC003710]